MTPFDDPESTSRASAGDEGRRWIVSGRVQGVGFRHHVWMAAQALSVVGDVRNLADGRVEIRARGPAAALERLLEAVRSGPRWARVEAIVVAPLGAESRFEEFSVR